MKRRKRPRRLDHTLDIAFAKAIRQTPAEHRPGLLHWLRRFRRHPTRIFYELDPHTGRWRRL